jgi:hypothetical protein
MPAKTRASAAEECGRRTLVQTIANSSDIPDRAIQALIEVQQAIEVIDLAVEELEEAELEALERGRGRIGQRALGLWLLHASPDSPRVGMGHSRGSGAGRSIIRETLDGPLAFVSYLSARARSRFLVNWSA